jgi:hypothetical protein
MDPKDFTNLLRYVTIRLKCKLKNGNISTGTGFVFEFCQSDGICLPCIVTNKHVIEEAVQCTFNLHTFDNNDMPTGNSITFNLNNFVSSLICHPNPEVDLCILPIGRLEIYASEQRVKVLRVKLNKSALLSIEQMENLSAIENILMVGYPIGIADDINNFPIFRRGITATHPNTNYNGKSEFLIDMACFPGSSGSPIFLFNSGIFTDRNNIVQQGMELWLLGILYAGPQYSAEGNIEILDIPTSLHPYSITDIPCNLGCVIKVEKMLEFEKILREKIPQLNG